MKRLSHYIGIGSAGAIVEFPDSQRETCTALAGKLSGAAHAVAQLAAIEHEGSNPDEAHTAATMLALQVLTGLAAALTQEADANGASQ